MKIVIAPDSFKGCLAARDVARELERGLARALPAATYDRVPIADGGEGTVDALVAATGGRRTRRRVTGPLGDPVDAWFGILGDGRTAVIEMAAASGLPLVPERRRNPLKTTSFGTGELVRAAIELGCRRIILGLGGSATNDGGAGLAQALGFRFVGAGGKALTRPLRGCDLLEVSGIDPALARALLAGVTIEAACDVNNPLTGRTGASAVYGPQKGATPAMVAELDAALGRYGVQVEKLAGRRLARTPGTGAAGGAGLAILGLLGGSLTPGVDLVLDAVALPRRLRGATLVVTGEGRIDQQTAFGKAPAGVAACAREAGVPVVGVGGGVVGDIGKLGAAGFDALESLVTEPMSLDDAISQARPLLRRTGERIGCWLLCLERLHGSSTRKTKR